MSFELDRIEELCNDRGWSHYRLAKEMDIPKQHRKSFPAAPLCHVFLHSAIYARYSVSPWESFTVQTAARRS